MKIPKTWNPNAVERWVKVVANDRQYFDWSNNRSNGNTGVFEYTRLGPFTRYEYIHQSGWQPTHPVPCSRPCPTSLCSCPIRVPLATGLNQRGVCVPHRRAQTDRPLYYNRHCEGIKEKNIDVTSVAVRENPYMQSFTWNGWPFVLHPLVGMIQSHPSLKLLPRGSVAE